MLSLEMSRSRGEGEPDGRGQRRREAKERALHRLPDQRPSAQRAPARQHPRAQSYAGPRGRGRQRAPQSCSSPFLFQHNQTSVPHPRRPSGPLRQRGCRETVPSRHNATPAQALLRPSHRRAAPAAQRRQKASSGSAAQPASGMETFGCSSCNCRRRARRLGSKLR